jgi:hypothetical protein
LRPVPAARRLLSCGVTWNSNAPPPRSVPEGDASRRQARDSRREAA